MVSYYKQVFENNYAGKYVLADICRHGCVDQNTFNPNSERMSDFNEGRRAMALHILNTLGLTDRELRSRYHLPDEGELDNVIISE